jgi:branched-subunit amino acid transport protein AzlD
MFAAVKSFEILSHTASVLPESDAYMMGMFFIISTHKISVTLYKYTIPTVALDLGLAGLLMVKGVM